NLLERGLTFAYGSDLDVADGDVIQHSFPLTRVGFQEQQSLDRPAQEVVQPVEKVVEDVFTLDWFRNKSQRTAREGPLAGLIRRNDTNWNMASGKIVLQPLQDAPAADVRKENIQRNGTGRIFPRQREGGGAQRGDQSLKSFVPRGIQQKAREAQIVLHDQEHAISGLNEMAIVAGLVGQRSNAWLHNLRQGRCGGKTIAALGRGSQ